jgi:hypothetical protein
VILRNDRKRDGSNEPDYVLMSGDEPEVDEYAQRGPTPAREASRARASDPFDATADESPF